MKYFTKTINDKDYNFRITSGDICELEKKSGANIQQFVMDVTFDKCVTLIRYMRKSSDPQFGLTNAQNFVDELIDEGYSLETIYTEIIFPTCVESGILTQVDLNKIQDAITNQHKKSDSVNQ